MPEYSTVLKLIKSKSVLIFDFDGVLVDSVEVKTRAFAELYSRYGDEVIRMVVEHHRANGGMSRFDKFKYYHSSFLNKEITEKGIAVLSERFSQLVREKVVNASAIPGAIEFIQQWCRDDRQCIINSATPEEEIRNIVLRRGWEAYFSKVYGSPDSKSVNLKYFLKTQKIDASECVFFGDAKADLAAANSCGVDFVGVGAAIAGLVSNEAEIPLLADFSCLVV